MKKIFYSFHQAHNNHEIVDIEYLDKHAGQASIHWDKPLKGNIQIKLKCENLDKAQTSFVREFLTSYVTRSFEAESVQVEFANS